jgi:hypothetical protein
VEGLTRIPPLIFNLAGLGFFLTVALLAWRSEGSKATRRIYRVLLLAGIAVEGVLFAYQHFVARAFCSWCLVVLALVVLLNLLADARQTLAAGAVFAGAFLAFASLRFGIIQPAAGQRALDRGTYGVRRCEDPARQLYLIFSSTCPHCEEVLRALEACTGCNFRFNPIDQISGLALPGVERTASYDPGVNRGLLALLGIDQVPVLLAPDPEAMRVISGQTRILAFIREECFKVGASRPNAPALDLGSDTLRLLGDEKEDGCGVTMDCQPENLP